LIQRTVEAAGIPTVSITIVREYTEKVKPPRAIFLRWPFGHPLGEAGHPAQQAAVLTQAFDALYAITEPGQIVDINWRWRRQTYPPVPWTADPPRCRPD
jgi:D-proline reductase (dithiol) PrdB